MYKPIQKDTPKKTGERRKEALNHLFAKNLEFIFLDKNSQLTVTTRKQLISSEEKESIRQNQTKLDKRLLTTVAKITDLDI